MVFDPRIRKTIRWTFIGACIGEGAGLLGCFYLYRKMKTSRDLRKKVYDFDQRIINVYYDMNEKYGNMDLRQDDAIAWGIPSAKKS